MCVDRVQDAFSSAAIKRWRYGSYNTTVSSAPLPLLTTANTRPPSKLLRSAISGDAVYNADMVLKLYYFPISGKAEVARLLLTIGDVPFEV